MSTVHILRDANNHEYVETCKDWVRATLVMLDNAPHIRVQEHHEAGSGRLHLGPRIPLDEWLLFKGAVDTLVGPFLRDPQNLMPKPMLKHGSTKQKEPILTKEEFERVLKKIARKVKELRLFP